MSVNERARTSDLAGNKFDADEKKNRVKRPEGGRETRGISNEYNVGSRRTPIRELYQNPDRKLLKKFKEHRRQTLNPVAPCIYKIIIAYLCQHCTEKYK